MNLAIQIQRDLLKQMMEHAQHEIVRECCGLLAGHGNVITQAFPAENVASDPAKTYEIAPRQIVQLLREFRERRLGFLGIYHSHPKGDNVPSPRDIELAYYSEAAYFIVTPRPYAAKPVRAFSIRNGRVTELEIETIA